MKLRVLLYLPFLLLAACQEATDPAPAPAADLSRAAAMEGARVYFISPADSARVSGPEVKVTFGLSGMGIAPAGIDFPGTGHHHLLVNVDMLPPEDLPIPADSNHVHFGLGQTEAVIELASGTHTLQLLLGDRNHVPHDPPVMSEQITIFVD